MSTTTSLASIAAITTLSIFCATATSAETRPNILFCISDDQSYAHTGANGDPVVSTPAFDRVAREGIRFTRAFCDAPSCGPSRSAILTGQHIWRLEEAGNIHSTLPARFATYTEMLEAAGYVIGYTGKGWSPGRLVAELREPGGPIPPRGSHRRVRSPIHPLAARAFATRALRESATQNPQCVGE